VGVWMPCLVQRRLGGSGVEVRLGHEVVDDYLRFVAARCRPNSVLATGFDLKVFFAFVGKEPVEVTTTDVFEFITEQRMPRRGNVVRLVDGEVGLSSRTIRRRVATLSGLFGYVATDAVVVLVIIYHRLVLWSLAVGSRAAPAQSTFDRQGPGDDCPASSRRARR
jgi:integrase/recombinase XerD